MPSDEWSLIQMLHEERAGRLDRLISFNGQAVFAAVAAAATMLFAEQQTRATWSTWPIALFGIGALALGAAVVWNWNYNFDRCRELSDGIRAQPNESEVRRLVGMAPFPGGLGPLVFIGVAGVVAGAVVSVLTE